MLKHTFTYTRSFKYINITYITSKHLKHLKQSRSFALHMKIAILNVHDNRLINKTGQFLRERIKKFLIKSNYLPLVSVALFRGIISLFFHFFSNNPLLQLSS